jgi:hypothetical protein
LFIGGIFELSAKTVHKFRSSFGSTTPLSEQHSLIALKYPQLLKHTRLDVGKAFQKSEENLGIAVLQA